MSSAGNIAGKNGCLWEGKLFSFPAHNDIPYKGFVPFPDSDTRRRVGEVISLYFSHLHYIPHLDPLSHEKISLGCNRSVDTLMLLRLALTLFIEEVLSECRRIQEIRL